MAEEHEYVTTPQNDKEQIEQIIREYETEPSKGLAHGIQKDAIQNGVGARVPGSEPASYENWRFIFELINIGGKPALSFTDEGTTGLTGDILNDDEIQVRSMEGTLTSEQKLSRFLTRFESGENIGPGTFGRGKLIFQGGSKDYWIVCDSLRGDDGEYIAFDRKIIGNQLKQMKKPLGGENAKAFIEEISGGALEPLESPGTRITILNIKGELEEAVKSSVRDDAETNGGSLVKMIQETWWEIINKFDAKILVKWGDNVKRVELSGDMKYVVTAKDREDGWRIHRKKNFRIVVGDQTFTIKELKLAVSPKPIEEEMREIWVQRKRMKIGGASKYITPHHQIGKRLCGYVILGQKLEDVVEKCEGTTHYGFDLRRISRIRDTIKHELELFQQELGLKTESSQAQDRKDMLDVVNELNESARDLGLLTDFSLGTETKDVEIRINSFTLPNDNSKRVELNQQIGPVEFAVKNNTSEPQLVELFLTGEQRGDEKSVKQLHRQEISLNPNETKTISVEPFEFENGEFRHGEGVLIVAKILSRKSGEKMGQVSRMIWLGREEPETYQDPIVVTAYQPTFPRPKTRRVELTEFIDNIRFKISNTTAYEINVNVDLVVRKCRSPSTDYYMLKEIKKERDISIPAMSEKEYVYESIEISNEVFGQIFEGPANAAERKCEIFFNVRCSKHIPDLSLIKGKRLGKKRIDFYCGIDREGRSIFSDMKENPGKDDGRRSWYEGDKTSGYVFILNNEHPSYIFAKSYDADVKKWYIREQMLTQGYAIAVSESKLSGIAEKFSEELSEANIPPAESFLKIDEIIGMALKEMGG